MSYSANMCLLYCFIVKFSETEMKKIALTTALTPIILLNAAGLADGDWHYRESSRSTLLKIVTEYNTAVDVANSVTVASAVASTQGVSCFTDSPHTDSDLDPDPFLGETPDAGAHAKASDSLVKCVGQGCTVASAYTGVGLGLSTNHLKSTISVNTSVLNSRTTTDPDCPPGCDPYGTGWVAASWAAAWPLGQSGSITGIEVTMDMDIDGDNYSGPCLALQGGSGSSLTPDIIRNDEFTSVTIEYFDSNDVSLGIETLQGMVFSDYNGNINGHLSITGDLYDDPTVGGPFAQACAYGVQCATRNVTINLTPPAGTAHVEYSGETTSTADFEYMDVNRDGVIDYFDRVEIAFSYGMTSNDPGYLPWADLSRNGTINTSDSDILDQVSCIADLNGDGFIDTLDTDIYTAWFTSSDPAERAKAELTGDGNLDFFDVTAFTNMLASGC